MPSKLQCPKELPCNSCRGLADFRETRIIFRLNACLLVSWNPVPQYFAQLILVHQQTQTGTILWSSHSIYVIVLLRSVLFSLVHQAHTSTCESGTGSRKASRSHVYLMEYFCSTVTCFSKSLPDDCARHQDCYKFFAEMKTESGADVCTSVRLSPSVRTFRLSYYITSSYKNWYWVSAPEVDGRIQLRLISTQKTLLYTTLKSNFTGFIENVPLHENR
jgi:hypothetical protein